MRRRLVVGGGAAAGLAFAAPQATWARWAEGLAPAPQAPVAVGVLTGPQAEVMAVVRDVAAARGLPLRVEARSHADHVNADVARGVLDAAAFQDAVGFAAEAARRRDGGLVAVTGTITRPMAIYSRRCSTLHQLADGDTLAIPGDAPDTSRALILLHNHGLVGLRPGSGWNATPRDIVANRRRFRLVRQARGRASAAARLDRYGAVVLNHEEATAAGLVPGRDSIGIEDGHTPYADVLAVRRIDQHRPWVMSLVAACHADEVKSFLLEHYRGSVRRPW